MLYTVIKVYQASKIRLRNTKAYRAISYKDLDFCIEHISELSLVIFENIDISEFKEVKRYKDNTTLRIVVFNNEEEFNKEEIDKYNSIGVANICGLRKLQDYIENNLGYKVCTYISEEESNVVEIIETEDGDDGSRDENELDLFSSESDRTNIDLEKKERVKSSLKESLKVFEDNTESFVGKQDEDSDNNKSVILLSKDDLNLEEEDVFKDEQEVTDKINNTIMAKVIQEKEDSILNLEEQLKITLDKLSNISKVKENIELEKTLLNNKLNSIIIDSDVTEVIIGALDRDGYESKIHGLEQEISELNIKLLDINLLTDRIRALNDLINNKETEEAVLKEELTRLRNNTELDNTKAKMQKEVMGKLALSDLVNSLIVKIDSLKTSLDTKIIDYNKLVREFRSLQESSENVREQLNRSIRESDILKTEISNTKSIYEERIGSIVKDNNSKSQIISALQLEKTENTALNDNLSQRLSTLQEKFREVTEKYSEAKGVITKQKEEIEKYRSVDIGDLRDTKDILEKSNNSMMGEVGKYQKRLIDTEDKMNKQSTAIENLKKQIEALKQTNAAVTRYSTMSEDINFKCEYSGKAHIIPVLGSGSVGVTTTAISICNKLRGKVLFVDLDIVAPKSERYLRVKPIISGLDGFDKSANMYQTGLGAFLYKDIDYFINHEDKLVQNVTRAKDGFVLDYISGLYTKMQLPKYMAADFGQFFTYFGNKYDYIVCDMGRIGGSEVSNALTRIVDSIALKTVVVALHERADMRSLNLRMQTEKIRFEHCVWLLNMSSNSNMDETMKKCVGNLPYIIMPKKMDIYGEGYTFDKVNILKGVLSELCSRIVQG